MLNELGSNFKLIQSDWPYKTRPNSAQKKNTGNGFYKVKRHQLKEVEPQKKLRLQRSARRRKRLEVTMRRVGGDSQDSREHFNCNATSVRRSSSLFAFLALAGDCGGCWQCSWRSAMQEWRCKCCQCDKREGGEEEEELLALSRCCTARCSGPRNVKVCRRRKERDSPDLTRYHSALSQEVRSSCWTSSTFVQMLFTDLTPLL